MMQLWYLVAVVYMTIVGADQRLKIKSRSNRLTQNLQLWHEPSKRENCGIGFQWVFSTSSDHFSNFRASEFACDLTGCY